MSVQSGSTVRVLTLTDDLVNAAQDQYGFDARAIEGQELEVIKVADFLDTILSGAPEGALWVAHPDAPEGVLGLTPGEYELVAA